MNVQSGNLLKWSLEIADMDFGVRGPPFLPIPLSERKQGQAKMPIGGFFLLPTRG